jgi:chromosome segregation ATPase
MATLEELERRVRTVEEELSGERHVSRYMVEQAARNSEVLHSVRSEVGALTVRVDQLGGDMASVKAALTMHGRALDLLQQDVRQLRSEVSDIKGKVSEIAGKVSEIDGRVSEIKGEISEINRKLDVLIAAITPRDQP